MTKQTPNTIMSLELEQLKADLHRLIGKSRVNCQQLRNSLDFTLFAKWVGIECEIRMLLNTIEESSHVTH